MSLIYAGIIVFLLSVVCSLAILTSKIETWRKLVVVIALSLSGMVSYRLMNAVYGFPAFLSHKIDKTWILSFHADQDSGSIYLWLRDIDSEMPMSYRVPYSEKLHKKLHENAEKNQGAPYIGSLKLNAYPLERFDESVGDIEVYSAPAKE